MNWCGSASVHLQNTQIVIYVFASDTGTKSAEKDHSAIFPFGVYIYAASTTP